MFNGYIKNWQNLFWDVAKYLKNIWIYDKSNYIKLANQINWEELCEPLRELYSTKNWRNSKNVRIMISLEILKKMFNISDRELVKQLQTNIELKYFCWITNIYEDVYINSSSLTKFRNRLSEYPEVIDKIQNIHLKETIPKIPKKKQGQYDQDSTVIEENIKYPNDIDLLYSIVEKWWKVINKAKKIGKNFFKKFIVKWKRIAKNLYLKYHFSKKKSKETINTTKEQMIEIANWIIERMENIKKRINIRSSKEKQKLKKQAEEYIKIAKEIIEQQKTMLEKETKSIKNRIVSFHKPHIRPIVKWKQGKSVQFWSKAQIWMIWGKIALAVSLNWENEPDNKSVKKGIEKVEEIRGKSPSEVWYDKWGRWKENYEYLEEKEITNGIQGSPEWKNLDKKKRKRLYNRRAFNENIINDVLNHRGVNKNRYKKENAVINLTFGCIASNLKRVWL